MTRLLALASVVFLFFSGLAHATLTTIGTATYEGTDYNLIYMDDGPFGPITWLDYTRSYDTWQNQVNWASGLSFAEADIQLNPGYTTSVDWSTGWRLPSSGDNPQDGYNVTTSEMGYLYYEALGNVAFGEPGWELQHTGDFSNLQADFWSYWSGTEYSPNPRYAWHFYFYYGNQTAYGKGATYYALAVRPGEVSPVPEPATMLLLGTGLIGLAGVRRKFKR